MRNLLILGATVLVIAALTFWTSGSIRIGGTETPSSKTKNGASNTAPDFSYKTIDGKDGTLSSFQGKIVLINFWATWCAPCVVEFPKLVKLAEDHPEINVIALSSDMNEDAIRRFLDSKIKLPKKLEVSGRFDIAKDTRGAVTRDLYQTYELPETYIIGKDGAIARKVVGDTDWQSDEMATFLNSLK